MSITSRKITSTTVLRGTAKENALPVISNDFNPIIDDLTDLDTRLADLEDGSVTMVDLDLTGTLSVDDIVGNTTATDIDIASGTIVTDSTSVTISKDTFLTNVYPSGYITDSAEVAITAFAGGGQASATQLAKQFNLITTCATAGDSVKLPLLNAATIAGMKVIVMNMSGNAAADVFPNTSDTINGLAANTAVRLAPNSVIVFEVTGAANAWRANNIVLASEDGVVGAPAHTFSTQPDMGAYKVSATQLGFAVSGALKGGFDASGAFTDVISEQTATVGVTIDGALIKDGSFTGKQATATATADGLTTGALTGADQFVTVTSANANNIVALPLDSTVPVGTLIRAWVGANGCELRSNAADLTLTVNNVTMGTTNEAAIPATTLFKVEKIASLTWILTAVDEVGAVITAIIPDAV